MKEFSNGYNLLTEIDGIHSDMLMDIGVYILDSNEVKVFEDLEKESAFLILSGKVTLTYCGSTNSMERVSLFDEKPHCLHVSKGCKVEITALDKSEILIQKTQNDKEFEPIFYSPNDIEEIYLGDGLMQNTARRILRDIFNYSNAPYSNMVMGEIISFPGKWSSYPPHHHPQPEVYFHRFDKPQGFGVSVIGDNAEVKTHNSISVIEGGLCHPQVTAPGYAMYYCWMIRHLKDNPWTERIDDPQHVWLHDKNADIWGDNK